MKYITTITSLLVALSSWATITVGNTSLPPFVVTPEASSGLEAIYVIHDTNGATLTYNSPTASSATWSRFSSLGGANSEAVAASIDGNNSTIRLDSRDLGYIVDDGGRQHCYWIVNYANHPFELGGAAFSPDESDCSMTAISVDGFGDKITYYTVTGIPRELSRDITVEYTTLRWDETAENYVQESVTTTFSYLPSILRVNAPLCETGFTISGDRFLTLWGMDEAVNTVPCAPMAVEAHTTAEQIERDNDNEIADNTSDLGGSAPVEIIFRATVTDGGIFREWQFSRSNEFDIIDLRFNEEEFTYTFRENGTTFVRFMTANADGTCEYFSDTYQVEIGESKLLCPNAFSPGASEGVNDEWKVSYKSIIDFDCHIFNRWGVEVFSTTNPNVGWDGRYNGKLVPAGVYFYVIKAKGADGKNYSKKGDINIINYNRKNNPQNPSE